MNSLVQKLLATKPADNTRALMEFLSYMGEVIAGSDKGAQPKPFFLSERDKWATLRRKTPIVYCGKFAPKNDGIVVDFCAHALALVFFSLLEYQASKTLTEAGLKVLLARSIEAKRRLDVLPNNAYFDDTFLSIGYFVSAVGKNAVFKSSLRKPTLLDRTFISTVGGHEQDIS
ncbi:MAG: hypothetical protein AAB428_02485 [Patescibacteria group bacterium]